MSDPTRIQPVKKLKGMLSVPPDKSISHRAALVSLLSETPVAIYNYLLAEDTLATLSAIEEFGARVARAGSVIQVEGVGLHGAREPQNVIDARNSGTLIRIILGIAAGFGKFAIFTGDDMLRRRPMGRVVRPLKGMGTRIEGAGDGERLPLAVLKREEDLRGGEYRLAVASAQVKSSLLFAGLFAQESVSVIEPGRSRDHTERLFNACGVEVNSRELPEGKMITVWPQKRVQVPGEIVVPGDFSSAAFWVAAAVIIPGSEVRLRGVGLNPTRTGFLDILRRMGAEVKIERLTEDAIGEPVGEIVARHSGLKAVRITAEDVPGSVDELPLLALVGAFAVGETVVEGAQELRVKETDRISTVCKEFQKIGVDIQEYPDGFRVTGGDGVRGGQVDSWGDHRLAMGLAIAGLASKEGVEVNNMKACAVSYPRFLEDMERIACW